MVEFSPGGEEDTSGEAENTVIPGMQHKYRQTALILSTNQCAMYCRHCFRKRLVGSSETEIASQKDDGFVCERTCGDYQCIDFWRRCFFVQQSASGRVYSGICEIDHIDYT